MSKYPKLPCLIIALLLIVAALVIWNVASSHVNIGESVGPTVATPSNQDAANVAPLMFLPIPIAVAVVQVCGLFMTVMLAFFPIQSAAFHQSKKALLDELLSLLERYEEEISTISDGVYKHQTACGIEDFTVSRASLSIKQKASQSLRNRIGTMLPKDDREKLESASTIWWGAMFQENGWATSKTRCFKNKTEYCEQMLQAQSDFMKTLGDLRVRCLFDEIKYWVIRRK